MKGIGYIVDERGKKKALVIDIKYERAIEDFMDGLIAEQRRKESKKDFNKVVSKILKKRKA